VPHLLNPSLYSGCIRFAVALAIRASTTLIETDVLLEYSLSVSGYCRLSLSYRRIGTGQKYAAGT